MAQFDFSTDGIAERQEGLPAGEYTAVVEDSDFRPTKSGSGELISVTLQVIEGQHRGRKIFDNMNIKHEKEIVQKIGKESFAELLRACGKPRIKDTAEIHGIPILIRVGLNKEGLSVVKRYKPRQAFQTMSSNSTRQDVDTPPWAKK